MYTISVLLQPPYFSSSSQYIQLHNMLLFYVSPNRILYAIYTKVPFLSVLSNKKKEEEM